MNRKNTTKRSKVVYLDHQATTPVDPRVLAEMKPFFRDFFENPHTDNYRSAVEAREAVEKARIQVAHAVGSRSAASIIFTGSATEANNLAIRGTASAAKKGRDKIVTLATEHKSVLEPVKAMADNGFEISVLKVRRNGLVDLDVVRKAVDSRTLLLSVMLVNNETGVIQQIKKIAEICHKHGVIVHSDCAQALGKIPVDVSELDLDLATFSAHKAYGPKGVGCLYVRQRPKVRIKPIILGGGQEGGLRSGTLPVPLCVGFGVAAKIAGEQIARDMEKIAKLAHELFHGIKKIKPDVVLNGDSEQRAPGCLNIMFPGYRSDSLLNAIPQIAASTGSACAATETKPSHVLRALGLSKEQANSSVRFGIGRGTTRKEISKTLDSMNTTIKGELQ